jgi:hypothetical protein
MDSSKPSYPQQVPTLTEVVEVSEAALPELADVLIDLSDEALALSNAAATPFPSSTEAMDALAAGASIEASVDDVLQRISNDPQFREVLDQAVAQAVQQALSTVMAELRERLVSDLQARSSTGPNVRPAP